VKKLLVLLFAVQLFSGRFLSEELLRLPALVQHFFHHVSEENENISFSEFLAEHYTDTTKHPAHQHNEENDHNNMPLKAHDHGNCCASAFNFCFPEIQQLSNKPVPSALNYEIEYSVPLRSQYDQNIWQPPKIS
jgi:hypothetical protein